MRVPARFPEHTRTKRRPQYSLEAICDKLEIGIAYAMSLRSKYKISPANNETRPRLYDLMDFKRAINAKTGLEVYEITQVKVNVAAVLKRKASERKTELAESLISQAVATKRAVKLSDEQFEVLSSYLNRKSRLHCFRLVDSVHYFWILEI